MGAPSPRCTAEFKQKAVELYKKSGTAYAEVARGPGCDAGSLSDWVKKADAADCGAGDNPFQMAEDLRRLKRENERLKRENEILLAAYINTFIAMLNKILRNHGLDTIRAGIGLAAGHDHIIKAGRKGVGINSTVWIGDAVAKASKLSSYGDKNGFSRIVMNSIFYSNLADVYKNKYPEKDFESWYSTNSSLPYFGSRHGSVIISDMNDWVNSGMID